MEHPNYDQWWQERDSRRSCYDIDPAVLIVGGLFDAEDCYGAWELYKAIRKQSPQTDLEIIMGPWHHGAWNGKGQSNLGNIDFGSQTVLYYRNNIEYPFLQYHLNNTGNSTPTSQRQPFSSPEKTSGSNSMHGHQQAHTPFHSIWAKTEH